MTSISSALPLTPLADGRVSGTNDLEALKRGNPQDIAKEFESLFVSMLLKQMRQASEPEEGLFPGDSSDTYGGIFDLYMGRHIAHNGGIGLAESIETAIGNKRGFPADEPEAGASGFPG